MRGTIYAPPNETIASLKEALRSRRKELGLTKEQLAELSGVSTRFVHDLEDGKTSLQLDLVVAVPATTLGLDLTWRLREPVTANQDGLDVASVVQPHSA